MTLDEHTLDADPDEPSPLAADADISPDGELDSLIFAIDAELMSGSTSRVPQDTSFPPEQADSIREVTACLVLLHSAARAGHLDDLADVARNAPPSAADSFPFQQVGPFHVVRELGRGGYGVVLLAVDTRLGRRVAIKVPRPEVLVTAELRRRFLREAEAAGSLQHPNLVAVFEAGEAGPLCYLATEYCAGPTLAEWLRQFGGTIAPRDAARLIAAVADGVAHAHARGVLHRDIKPSNVMLEPLTEASNTDGEVLRTLAVFTPKLTDFGLAKLLERQDDETRTGTVLGTPAYMSPEQATGRLRDICAATDVYGLGVVLYEMLTGRPPFKGENDPDTLRRLCLEDPLPPSRIRSEMPGDLAAIVLKCLEKHPAARYASAAELATDLRRYLVGEPTLARPLRWDQRTLRWAQRRPLIAGLLGIIAAGTICLFAVIALSTVRLSAALAESERRRNEANTASREAARQRAAAEVSERRAVASQHQTQRLLYTADIQLADEAYRAANPREAVAHLSRYFPSSNDGKAEDLRDFAFHYLWHRCQNRLLTLRGHAGAVFSLEYAPHGKWVATAGQDGTIRLWDAGTGQQFRKFDGHRGDVNAISISPDSSLLASAGADGTIRIWDTAAGVQLQVVQQLTGEVFAVRFSASGKLLAAGDADGVVQIWNTDTWQRLGTLQGHTDLVESIDFAPDEHTLASAGTDSQVILWDLANLRQRATWEGQCGAVYVVRFSPAGGRLAAGGQNGDLVLWDVATGTELRRTQAYKTRLTSLAFSPDGTRIVTASRDPSARLWDVATGRLEAAFDGHAERLWCVAFAPDGDSFATASSDGTAKLCKLSEQYELLPQYSLERGQFTIDNAGAFHAISRNGAEALSTKIFEEGSQRDGLASIESATTIVTTALDSTGSTFVAVNKGGELFVRTRDTPWTLAAAAILHDNRWPPAISPDGRLVALGISRLQVIDWRNGPRVIDAPYPAPPCSVQFSHDGCKLAAALAEGRVAVWNVNQGATPRLLSVNTPRCLGPVCFSADDLQLAAASEDGRIFVLNAIDGSVQHNLAVHPGMPTAVAFSHDGRNLATAGQDRIVRIWDLRTGQNLVTLDNLRGAALSLVFGPHDDELLANLEEGEVVRWTAPRDPGGQRRFAATDVALHQAMPNAAPVRALPWGDVRRNESLPEVFQQFAWLSGVGFKVLRPTFDDREEDQGLLLGALMLTHARNETLQAATTITDNDFVWLSRNADREARQLGKAGYADLFTGRLPSVVLLESGSFERRDVSVKELGEIDSDRDRIREIHRWAKAHGYVGGFPNFDDGEREGEAVYGAVLIKTGHGEEVFLPASTVWPTADSSPR